MASREGDRRLMVSKAVEGHSINERAEMPRSTPTAIKVRMFRARQKLVQAAAAFGLKSEVGQAIRLPGMGATAQTSRM